MAVARMPAAPLPLFALTLVPGLDGIGVDAGDRQVWLLPDELLAAKRTADPAPAPGAPRTLAEVEKAHILAVLASCGGETGQAAQVLGIGRSTLWRKLQRYG
jgi:two-component system response regulator HydG